MKTLFKKFFIKNLIIFLLIINSIFSSCSFWEETFTPPIDFNSLVTEVNFSVNTINVNVGEKVNFNLRINPSEYQNIVLILWETGKNENNEDLIEITTDNYGAVLTGKKAGSTWVKATCNGIVATCLVNVISNNDDLNFSPYIYSNEAVVEMLPETTYTLQTSLYGGTIEDMEDFTWTVSNSSVAEIIPGRNNCIVKSHNPGAATITAKHPKATYEYSFIIYVYTDKLTIPYITTTNNVLTIDRNENSSKKIRVDLMNPYTSSYINDFKWDYADESSRSIIDISSSQHECEVRGLTNGIARIKVTHPQTEYPLYIVVRVNTIVKNVYIGLSQSTLVISGSDSMHSITATIENYSGVVDLEKFVFEVPPEASSIMDYNVHGNVITIQGKKNGKVQIKVSHELSELKRTLLIILQEQIGSALDASMYITTDQNYVQTKVGEPATRINVNLIGGIDGEDNVGDVNQNFSWYITGNYLDASQKNDFVEFHEHTVFLHGRSAVNSGKIAPAHIDIKPVKEGNFTIHVAHPRCLYETEINVRVLSEYALTEPPVIINTDKSIYYLENNSMVENVGYCIVTPVLENSKSSDSINKLAYISSDPEVITLEPNFGPSTKMSAVSHGQHSTYVNIHLDGAISDKKLLVLSADTLEEAKNMKAMYCDTSYTRLTAETEKEITLHIENFLPYDNIEWKTLDSSIVIVNGNGSENNRTAVLKGISKGRTYVTASFSDCPDVIIEVTVLPVGESPDVINPPKYLTTNLNAVVIEEENGTADLSVTGVNINNQTGYIWEKEEKTASPSEPAFTLFNTGLNTATIQANKAGKAIVHVSHPESENTLDINVKCGSLLEWTDGYIPYIVCENGEDVVNIVTGQTKTIGCALANSSETGIFNFSITHGFTNIEIVPTVSGTCTITAKQAGQAIITVSNSIANDVTKEILVNIANSEEELKGFKYLTTKNNVVNVGQGESKTVLVDVINSNNPILSGYYWTSTDTSKATVVGSGNTAVIYGNEIGTVKINVENTECEIPLEIIVNVVDPIAAIQDPFISCPNIITCIVGSDAQDISAELIGGDESQSTAFTWSSEDPAIAVVQGNNSNAKIKALKEGVTRIVVQHPSAIAARRILVICEPKINTDCYISLTESIIKMAPSDSAKTITATLVNGNSNDIYDFKWWADDYKIITMNPAQNECLITPISAGTVNLHVSHPKAQNQKDIVLYISQYNDFAFAENNIELETGGADKFIQMEVPASSMKYEISFESSNPKVCTAWGNTTVCSLHPGQTEGSCTITARLKTKGGSLQGTAELLVANVKKNETRPYIGLDGQTVLSLNIEESKKLSAALYGSNLIDKDSRGLRWEISKEYKNIIAFTNNSQADDSSIDSYVKGKECQIKALNNGKAVLKITHEDDNGRKISPLLIYVIVNGTAEPSISFNWPQMDLLTGEESQELIASINNSIGEEPQWIITQTPDNPKLTTCCDIVTNGLKSIISPKNTGKVEITATLKSNGSMAKCVITVTEPPRLEFFVYEDEINKTGETVIDHLNVYPGKNKNIYYRTLPKKKSIKPGTAGHYLSDSNRISCNDFGYGYNGVPDNIGTIVVTGASTESESAIYYQLTTEENISKSITLTNLYNYSFTVDKTALVMSVSEAIDFMNKKGAIGPIKYKVSPSCSEVQLTLYNDQFSLSSLKNLPTIYYMNSSGNLVPAQSNGNLSWVIKNHMLTDPVTEVSEGEIWIKSENEFLGTLQVTAVNKQVISGGSETQHVINNGYNILLSWYYQEHTFDIIHNDSDYIGINSDGYYSKYNSNTNSITLGDGEHLKFRTKVRETKSSMYYTNVTFVPSSSNIKDQNGKTQKEYVTGGCNIAMQSLVSNNDYYYCSLNHGNDYGSNGNYYYRIGNNPDPSLSIYEQNNKTVKEYSYIGHLKIQYQILDGTEKDYRIPVYVEVRNCTKSYY